MFFFLRSVSIPIILYPAGPLLYIHTATANSFNLAPSSAFYLVHPFSTPLVLNLRSNIILSPRSVNTMDEFDVISYAAIFWKQEM